MNSAVVNVKIDQKLKKRAQKVASDLGFSLSSLINAYLKELTRTKTVTFSTRKEEPSEYLIQSLKESAEDIKAGQVISFETWQEEQKYLNDLIDHDRKHKKS
ncbi:MAG: hypothetical protein A3F33_03045 [Candidatus Woykebacteria bacterium RIFCSPHIGHO2_12_FULL_43_10]|uniref:Damage-inducible protein J n=2 Tax=Candidatus Woykeibacteriota TaxID=1817899 RepID=A0A1G1WXI6_9BACT|nr:MAG: hypothetical protein A2802_01670 [Candidatus Woykebacteria bacterium RIFCSPHIGHO2_01_FULL_43_29]OGY28722.1 MAG: hypothetical protein A3J50_01250 [Candidatus Woykebacteria bacterium RIFCSPHIGHO2_02_FULL_43_16b]OGY29798.1 MAG: hypothetical protein A3F33_03045 [Candidatus Woykebacteria bacterium RIFCSPHIGHO2_12_FULL_43_10]OGY32472.1 MAG: hypothetical protein A3A61_00775 [Candidatus Woykebacteria bacterium RIFCSPLOWO2_01_FULL_43_14]